jgi:hypothetical protein
MAVQSAPAPVTYAGLTESVAVRDSMNAAPRLLALPLTMLTGKPHTGQRPLHLTPGRHLAMATCSMALGLVLSFVALRAGGWWSLLVVAGGSITLHGARNARMMVYHQAAHRNMWARSTRDRVVGRIVAGLLMVQDFSRYAAEHVQDHHAINHMTVRDPTVQAFLIGLELSPGMSRRAMWRHLLWRKLFSPAFHLSFLIGRIQSYFAPASWPIRIVTAAVYLGVAAASIVFDFWLFLLLAWVLPMTFFYQISNTMRLLVKHTFPDPAQTERRGKAYFASLTNGIMMGEAAPAPGMTHQFWAWTRWWARMLTIHFPARYLVLTGDTVVHDFHHRRPMSRDWANYIFARQADQDSGHGGWPPYREVWGLLNGMNIVLDSLSRADPVEYHRDRIQGVSKRSLFSAFDD